MVERRCRCNGEGMIALRVSLNGKQVCVAGAEDLAVLNAIVNAVGNLGAKTKRTRDEPLNVYLHVGGLTARAEGADAHVRWAEELPLEMGDRIEVEVLETEEVDAPGEIRPAESPEERERFRFEHAKETYFALRAKFEG